jgi:membrane dipeptidase
MGRWTGRHWLARGAGAAVATGGGVLGARPAGIGITDLRGFGVRTFALIDTVGLAHVCLGTDMHVNYKPVFDTHANLPHCVAGLQQRGLREDEVAKLTGGNFLRVLSAAQRG